MAKNDNTNSVSLNILTMDKSNEINSLGLINPNNLTFFDLINNTVVHNIIQKDKGIQVEHNDCWSKENNIQRFETYSLIENKSKKIFFSYLTDNNHNRLILPVSFKMEFNYLGHSNVSLRFVNLEESFQNINIDNFSLKTNDHILISYENNKLVIFINNKKIKSYSFSLKEGKGYFTWRLSKDSFIKFSDFELYSEDSIVSTFFSRNDTDKNYERLLQEVINLKERFDNFEQYTNEVLESNNFLFNNLFLDHELKSKNLLKYTQDLCTELLSFVGNVCKKYDLEWWLDYGTLLGAIRHQYFIPWDDDVDIGMMRKEYNQLNEVIIDEIKENKLDDILRVSYRKRKIDNNKVNSFLQIFDIHKTDYAGNTIFAGVDVFPYDFIMDYDEETINEIYYNTKLDYYRELTEGNDFSLAYNGLDPDSVLKNYYKSLNLNMDYDKYVIPGVEGACGLHNLYKLMIFKSEDVFPLKNVPYGDYEFYAPNNSYEYLKNIYGNFMEVPPTIRTHNRVGRFRYDEKAPEIFKDDLKRIYNVNKKFKF